jgi:hypothetical protein
LISKNGTLTFLPAINDNGISNVGAALCPMVAGDAPAYPKETLMPELVYDG